MVKVSLTAGSALEKGVKRHSLIRGGFDVASGCGPVGQLDVWGGRGVGILEFREGLSMCVSRG